MFVTGLWKRKDGSKGPILRVNLTDLVCQKMEAALEQYPGGELSIWEVKSRTEKGPTHNLCIGERLQPPESAPREARPAQAPSDDDF
jgi:hypothetical protein